MNSSLLRLVRWCSLAFALSCSVAFSAEAARTTIPLLNDWRFSLAGQGDTPAAPGFDDATWDAVTLPHTWNNFDGQDGGNDYHRGAGWYRLRFRLPSLPAEQRVLVEFDAACKVADVFVNGRPVGTHTGAFARFRFDLTDFVNRSGDNLLAVRVDNSPSQIVPISGDFTQYGGLYRPARLLITAPVHIATLDHASPGVYLVQRKVTADQADVDARIQVVNDSKQAFTGSVQVQVNDAEGHAVAQATQTVSVAAGGNATVVVPVAIKQPRRWNGVSDPYLYRTTIAVLTGQQTVDAITQPLGVRDFSVGASTGFALNGRPLPLRGVNRHQDRPDKGWAISEQDHRQDMEMIRELGANAVRLAHYQHDQYFYDLCDTNGLAVWAEFGLVNEPPATPEARANAAEQLRELVRQNYNHPSIFFWSIGNETRGKNDDPEAKSSTALLTELAAAAAAEDPTRPSVYASHHSLTDPRNTLTKVIAFNKYFGWYSGKYPELGSFLDKFHAANPDLPIGISEYGAGASLYQHELNPPARKHQAKGPWHPEEWQTTFHEESWLQIKDRPWLWGTFIWNMFDFSADQRAEGDQYGRNDKGLVTYDRQTRKDAFYWYQANWATKPMVHIVGKRFWERSDSVNEVKVYSNAEEVELRLNGTSLGKLRSTDHRFVWPKVALLPGQNRLEAYAYQGGKVVTADWGGLTWRADGDPRPNRAVVEADEAAKSQPK
jgi:beta-galactosidase